MSTGLIVNGDDEGERGALAKKSFGVVILDEAHKARASARQRRDTTSRSRTIFSISCAEWRAMPGA